MKIRLIKSPLILVLILSIIATSCLKDKAFENGSIQSGSGGSGQDIKVISLGITVSDTTNFLQASYDLTNNDTTVNLVPVELGGLSAASQDIHVTLTENDQLVVNYNDSNGTDYVNPGTNITIINNVVTIPKGSRTGYLQVKFKPTDLLNGNFAYGFVITSVAEPGYTIGNLNHGIVALGPKNIWDGLYGLTIETIGWGAYNIADGLTFTWPTKAQIITTGIASDRLATAEVGSSLPAFDPNGGLAGFGATSLQFTFDAATNKITNINNLVPDDGRGRFIIPNPAITDNRYDPVSKTIYAAFILKQNGRPDQQFYDTLVYKGPR